MNFHDELFSRERGESCDVGQNEGKRISLRFARRLDCFDYFGTAAVPVTVNPASDFASVS
jgi:hypothetical protein